MVWCITPVRILSIDFKQSECGIRIENPKFIIDRETTYVTPYLTNVEPLDDTMSVQKSVLASIINDATVALKDFQNGGVSTFGLFLNIIFSRQEESFYLGPGVCRSIINGFDEDNINLVKAQIEKVWLLPGDNFAATLYINTFNKLIESINIAANNTGYLWVENER